jgi:hypothetical protein
MPFHRRSGDIEKLAREYRGRVEFLLVYIREAHPGSTVPLHKDGKPTMETIGQTNDVKERMRRAEELRAELKLSFPAAVDLDDNKVNAAFAGWPERLVVVDRDGNVAFKSTPGPKGFKPEDVGDWLKKNVK